MNQSEFKNLKCLMCDKFFRTTIEMRICSKCKLAQDNTFHWEGRKDGKLYGDMGVWEKV